MNRKMQVMVLVLNLPTEIIIDIFSRLPVQTIISCKFVCKKWFNLISSPQFAKTHLFRSTPGLIVLLAQKNETSCRMFEFEDKLGLQHHDLHYKPLMKFDPRALSSSPDSNITIEGSANGLLCLYDNYSKVDALYVCNPITREYTPLPLLPNPNTDSSFPVIITYGFGISALSDQYKVIQISHGNVSARESGTHLSNLKNECIVYTLGTHEWRSIKPNETYEYSLYPTSTGTFLNGNLHWLVEDAKRSELISCFDLETELFNKPFSPPPDSGTSSMTVLGDCLCLCDFGSGDSGEEIVMWIMKEYGVEGSWTKQFVIIRIPDPDAIYCETVHALKVFKDGDILMRSENTCMFYHCSMTKANHVVDFVEPGWIDAFLHTPSFVSLKSLALENVTSF